MKVLNDTQHFRTKIKELLDSNSIKPSEFCSICGEIDHQKNELILTKCTNCTRHFHIRCHSELDEKKENELISCLECLKLIK